MKTIIICIFLILLALLGCVAYSIQQGNETDKQLTRWDSILKEAEQNGK